MSPVRNRKAGVASVAAVAVAASSLTYFAVTSKGETVHEADLNDGGVWVSSAWWLAARIARVEKPGMTGVYGLRSTSVGGQDRRRLLRDHGLHRGLDGRDVRGQAGDADSRFRHEGDP